MKYLNILNVIGLLSQAELQCNEQKVIEPNL